MARTVPNPGGGVLCPSPSYPQQMTVPSVLMAHVCWSPALRAVTVIVVEGELCP